MIPNGNTTDWIATPHDRVYYRSTGDKFRRGEFTFAKWIADHIPEWTVIITAGPYRGYDIRHDIDPDRNLIHLDFYSPGMRIYGPGIEHRPEHPLVEHAESVLTEIVDAITNSQNSN